MTTTTRCPACKVERVRYTVERDEQFDGGEQCMVMMEDGTVRSLANPKEAARLINRAEKSLAKRNGSARVAAIEWRDGLTPPKGM